MATEKRLIDAYAFGIFLMGRMGFNPANAETVSQWMDEFIKKNTVDAVEVVRCKDCVHWLNEDGMNDHVCLKIYSDGAVSSYAWQDRKPDDFCSYGERRTDNG